MAELFGKTTGCCKAKGGDPHFEVGTDDTALGQILCYTYIKKGTPITVEDLVW